MDLFKFKFKLIEIKIRLFLIRETVENHVKNYFFENHD